MLRISGIGDKMRRLHQLAVNPPPCANTIFYRYENTDDICDMWFEADDLARFYRNKDLPVFSVYEAEALISWLKNRSKSLSDSTEVPDLINFHNIAASLLEVGLGHVECKKCATCYSAGDLNSQKEPIHQGWNFVTYECPNGHTLLKHDYAHFSM